MSNDFDDTTPNESRLPSISRRSALDYFNPSNAGNQLRRWFGTREKVIEGLKTLGWVVPLTVLIWIYAERQQLVQNPVVLPGVGVRIHSDDPLKTARFNGPDPDTTAVTLKLMGPQEGVRKVVDELTRIPREVLTVNVGSNRPDGPSQINIAERLQSMELFKSNGVSIQEAQPPDLSVNIDTLGRRPVDVEVAPGHSDWSATIEPQKVSLSGPKAVLDQGNLKVYLRLDGYSQLKTPGIYSLKDVPVDLAVPAPAGVSIQPSHVDATVQVAQADETLTLKDPVVIYIEQGPDTMEPPDAYYFRPADQKTIDPVVVKGPKDQIDLLKNKTWVPKAIINPTSDDVEKNRLAVPPTFYLPPGVTGVNSDALKPIRFTPFKQ